MTDEKSEVPAGGERLVLTLNGGSSSLKVGLFEGERRLLSGGVERVGSGSASAWVRPGEGGGGERRAAVRAPDHASALEGLLALAGLAAPEGLERLGAVGHRVVHGGDRFDRPSVIDQAVLSELRRLSPLDPQHLPSELSLIEAAMKRFHRVTQVACFDTAFHHAMPRVARLLALPRELEAEGLRRFGFHGLSYTFVLGELARLAPGEAGGRVVIAHLGSGASMAAVHEGRPVDTTMGFTPASGLVMGTRSGDLDPGALIYLARAKGLGAEELDQLVNRRSGLLGVSARSADMRDLLSAEARGDVASAEAVALFCYQARKAVGALSAALSGLETLVFTAGIGERSAEVRARICQGLGHLGVELDEQANRAGSPVISRPGSRCRVRVIATDEERIIARETRRLVEPRAPNEGRTP